MDRVLKMNLVKSVIVSYTLLVSFVRAQNN
jgi:hypothetical protein